MSIDHERKTPYTRWLDKLDTRLSRPDLQELITIYAGAWTGKTEFTHFVARANADKWIPVCYISLEMPWDQLALRYAVKRAWIKQYIDYQDKKYTTQQWELIEQYYKEFKEYKNISLVGEEKEYTLYDLIGNMWYGEWLMGEYYAKWYKVFVIDNLWKIYSDKPEWDAQGSITSALQKWKNLYPTCVFLVHHTGKSKGWEANMRGSQKIMDNSTKVIKLEREMGDTDAEAIDKARLTIKQEKNSIRWEYVETDCYFDRWVYAEEFVWSERKKKEYIHEDKEWAPF